LIPPVPPGSDALPHEMSIARSAMIKDIRQCFMIVSAPF
jgi:hypothetical protein